MDFESCSIYPTT